MLGTLIAEALLEGKMKTAQAIRVVAGGENLILEMNDGITGKVR